MNENDFPTFDFDEQEQSMEFLENASMRTETIDLNAFGDITQSGSFDLSGVQTSTLGKLLNALPIPAFIVNRSYRIVFANKPSGEISGAPENTQQLDFSSFFPAGNSGDIQSAINTVFSDRKTKVTETVLQINGVRIWGRVHFLSVRLGMDRAVLMLVEDLTPEKKQLLLKKRHESELQKAHDELEQRVKERTAELQSTNDRLMAEIAQRKQVEEDLVREERFSATVIDSLPGIFYLFDERGQFLKWNKNFEKVSQYSTEEISRINPLDLFGGEDKGLFAQTIREVFLQGESATEAELISNDGNKTPYLFSGKRVILDEATCMVGMGIDITDRRRTENALKESEERMRLVIESSPIGIAIVQDGKCLFVNPNFAEMFGYGNSEELVGLPTEELFAAEERNAVVRHMKGLTKGKPSRSFDLPGQKSSGETFQASTWLTAIDYKDKPSLLWFAIDISQEKALRSQLLQAQKMEAIGTLAGGIAHDFNNLLTVILGFSEMLLMDRKEEDQDYADLLKIVQAARNGADLVRRILTFSRKVETKLRPTDLNHEVKQAQKLLNRTIPKMTEIELSLDPNLKKINGDPGQIEQILLNLAVNAQHAMPEGGRLLIETKTVYLDELYCQTQVNVNPGEYALLTFSDSGFGIERNIVEHIFEPFYTTKKPGEGTGLGLAMVFGIIRSHSGHITCYSEPGIGTTFKIYFPVIRMPGKSEVENFSLIPASGTETILLVDDEEFIRDLGRKILSRAGYKVITACNGIEAIETYLAKKDQISLILLDIIMPQMSGKLCLEELLKIDPKVRVVVASGFSVDDMAKGDIEPKVSGFVNKPYRMTEMLKVVRDVLDSSR